MSDRPDTQNTTILEAIIPDTGEVVSVSPNLGLPGHVSVVGLNLPEGLSFERWAAIGETLRGVERGIMWWIGDWVRYGERSYGETYAQALDATDYSYQTIRDAAWVSGQFQLSRRRDNLSFSHHKEVAALSPDEQNELLDCADNQQWSRNELRAEVNRRKNGGAAGRGKAHPACIIVESLDDLVAADKTFGTIYADPPWQYGNQATRASTGNHYSGMSVEEICVLPVARLAAPVAHLHLWTTNGFLFDAKRVMEAWGFEYRSCFVWVKPELGIGNYWRVSHEFLLLGKRGKATFSDRSLKSWGEFSRGLHSAKPEEVRGLIERASPGPRLEMFARRAEAPGWMVWGDGIDQALLGRGAERFAA